MLRDLVVGLGFLAMMKGGSERVDICLTRIGFAIFV